MNDCWVLCSKWDIYVTTSKAQGTSVRGKKECYTWKIGRSAVKHCLLDPKWLCTHEFAESVDTCNVWSHHSILDRGAPSALILIEEPQTANGGLKRGSHIPQWCSQWSIMAFVQVNSPLTYTHLDYPNKIQWGTCTHKVMKVRCVITGEKKGFSEREWGSIWMDKEGRIWSNYIIYMHVIIKGKRIKTHVSYC